MGHGWPIGDKLYPANKHLYFSLEDQREAAVRFSIGSLPLTKNEFHSANLNLNHNDYHRAFTWVELHMENICRRKNEKLICKTRNVNINTAHGGILQWKFMSRRCLSNDAIFQAKPLVTRFVADRIIAFTKDWNAIVQLHCPCTSPGSVPAGTDACRAVKPTLLFHLFEMHRT